ncbi:tRNA (cytidine(34)-2'-O)-methyltransferase [Spiribacter vilamensis]|uniref:tRNA (cytidine(34)-2'-O)-methyltransferase n=1 Tax=Spiribacter vilamensis TaxID=531306 RepID=A0A4Q8D283_9GAMM|nr:tRNA (cytidine/uridine-2'-O-)-methyltransferase [Spiribacter vilamensis]
MLPHVVLHRPEIPPNAGNVIRLCANSGARLHLIRPLGFALDDRRMRRAGLDYHEFASMRVHDDYAAFLDAVAPGRVWALTTGGRVRFDRPDYQPDDALLFGSETAGLPEAVMAQIPAARRLRLPMQPGNRSLNLSNSVAVTVYEAWRQVDFAGSVAID